MSSLSAQFKKFDRGGNNKDDLQDDKDGIADQVAVDQKKNSTDDEKKILTALIFYPKRVWDY